MKKFFLPIVKKNQQVLSNTDGGKIRFPADRAQPSGFVVKMTSKLNQEFKTGGHCHVLSPTRSRRENR